MLKPLHQNAGIAGACLRAHRCDVAFDIGGWPQPVIQVAGEELRVAAGVAHQQQRGGAVRASGARYEETRFVFGHAQQIAGLRGARGQGFKRVTIRDARSARLRAALPAV